MNGPEILNKFVGASEAMVRSLFADAETAYRQHGDRAGLHVIIFDEIDSLCRTRRAADSGSGQVNDSVVNQLLTKMDGIDSSPNVLARTRHARMTWCLLGP